MSTHDNGLGGKVGRSAEFESDFADPQSAGNAQGSQSWDTSTTNTQKSEVPYMVQGAGRPGQPNSGQRSIFGNSGPAFTQMPTYTPVTRAPAPQQPQAPQPAYTPPAPTQARPQAPVAPAQPAPQAPGAPSFQTPQPQPQAFGNQHYQPPFPAPEQAPSYGTQSPAMPDLSNADPGFPDSIFGDFKAADASFSETDFSDQGAADTGYTGQSYTDQSYADQSYADQSFADAGYPDEGGDASFPETNYAASPEPALGGGHEMAHGMYGGGNEFGHGVMPNGGEAHYDPAQPQAQMPQQQAYHPQAPQPQIPQSDPRRQLQAFDAVYDQPPQIPLGGSQAPSEGYFDADRGDADFLDESQAPQGAGRSKLTKSLRGRSAVMVASALLGAIALGGALAYAYKQSGGGMANGETPIVTADARPVKEAPDQPGGKEFPHKNKLIYDRLTNGDEPESERLVPRQEDVAVPALPPATATAGLPAPVATTDLANPATTESVDGAEDDGGPRKVKTLVVRPDGSVEAPAGEATQAAAAGAPAQAAPAGAMPVPAPEMPAPAAAAPAPQQVAAADPKPAPAPAANTKYVVQVGSKKSQTDALASFADIQQKYPKLLSDYRPIVQKADLGSKGVWYRLRVGPINDKTEAYKLCGQLKSQGLPDCLVMTQ